MSALGKVASVLFVLGGVCDVENVMGVLAHDQSFHIFFVHRSLLSASFLVEECGDEERRRKAAQNRVSDHYSSFAGFS